MSTKNTIIRLFIALALLALLVFIFPGTTSDVAPEPMEGKIDINVVCEEALAYMSFLDGESANQFVADCKEGKYPEVIEEFKKRMNVGDGALI